MKNILFVCTGNSARSIIAESIINHKYKDKFKGFSAGSNPSGKINPHIKKFLEKKGFNLDKYFSKNFDEFLEDKIKIDHIFTVCSNAHNEVCPIWPEKKEIIHWDIEDPVKKFENTSDPNEINNISQTTFDDINSRIENWIKNEK